MDNIQISKKEYFDLKVAQEILRRLEVGGVDNWEWYGESISSDSEEDLDVFKQKLKNELGISQTKVTSSGRAPEDPFNPVAPAPINPKTGQHADYWVLSKEERAKGFIRPVRNKYIHTKCGVVTQMSDAIAETYARNPHFYGSTFCIYCKDHFPVGIDGEFIWESFGDKVGT
jgi:hypothetical protein